MCVFHGEGPRVHPGWCRIWIHRWHGPFQGWLLLRWFARHFFTWCEKQRWEVVRSDGQTTGWYFWRREQLQPLHVFQRLQGPNG